MSLRGYDAWRTRCPEDDDALADDGCNVCVGNDVEEPCSPDCARIAFLAEGRRLIAGRYETCRNALRLARQYQAEGHDLDFRVRDCLTEVNRRRREIRGIRSAMTVEPDDVIRTALAHDLRETMPAPASERGAA